MMTRFESARRGAGACVLALALVACNVDEMLDVPDPDVATPTSIADKSALPTVLAGAQADIQVAYNGNVDMSVITGTGLFTDEFIWAETFPTRFEVDSRSIQTNNTTMLALFRNMQRARQSAVRAARAFTRFDPGAQGRLEALNLEGLVYIWFGENYCNGVPFSDVDDAGVQTFGKPMTNVEMFQTAIARFDSVLSLSGNAGNMATLAHLLKARASLDLNQTTQAAAEAAQVPTGFAYTQLHSENTTRQYNGTFEIVYRGRRFSVGNNEGGNGLPYRTDGAPAADGGSGARDPRVLNARTGPNPGGDALPITPFDNSTAYFAEQKYLARNVTDEIATYVEARLIEAEVSMRGGNPAWVVTVNALRSPLGLGPLVDPGTQTAREDLFFKERAYFLWLTGHRLGDLRRLVRQYGRNQANVFPNGPYFKGGSYGTDVNFPIPVEENNNPNSQGCIDRNA